jgi:hypothetical protein
MKRLLIHLLWIAGLTVAAALAVAQDTSCCTIVGLDTKRQLVTAIEQKTGNMFRFAVKDAAVFKTAKLCESFDGPVAETKKDAPFAADFGKADPKVPCCTLTTDVGGVGKVLGVRKYTEPDVLVILTDLKRTAGETLTARWQYCNAGAKVVKFPAEGCVGMGCTHTAAYGMHLLDGAARKRHDMLKDERGYLQADLHPPGKLQVGPNQIFSTWAKFNAPPESAKVMTVVIPRTNEPFEDVPIAP